MVWLVALVGCLESLGLVAVSLYRGQLFEAVVWTFITITIGFLASQIEKIKLYLEA
ncbi:MAG: hypothetical protein HYT80_02175 [Euryarchaeota archaeon]|nr:hypothetical protein [Euryarchaeota archaeon]